jgi:hypothetical protein
MMLDIESDNMDMVRGSWPAGTNVGTTPESKWTKPAAPAEERKNHLMHV